MLTVRRNDIRSALVDFYYGIIDEFGEETKTSKYKDFERLLESLSQNIRLHSRDSRYKEQIRKILKSELKSLRTLAKSLLDENNRFNNGILLKRIFGGLPLTKFLVVEQTYDLVIEVDSSSVKAVVFAPCVEEDGFDWSVSAKGEAERNFKRSCVSVDVMVNFPETELSLQETEKDAEGGTAIELSNGVISDAASKEQNVLSEEPAEKIADTLDNADGELEIGKVLFSKKDQFNLRADRNKDEINGFIYEQFIDTVNPLDILVLEDAQKRIKIYTQLTEIDINPISGGGYVRKFSEVGTHVKFHPILEIGQDYIGVVRPGDLTGFLIRKPNDTELMQVFSIPEQGVPIGWLDYNDRKELFRYPLEPKDTIYQSVMIAGVQGKGKSNALKMLITGFAASKHLAQNERPAMIVLDGEGEYKSFAKRNEMNKEAMQYLVNNGIDALNPIVYSISDDPTRSSATISMEGIAPEDIIYLMPELESKTESILRVLIDNACGSLTDSDRRNIQSICARINHESNNSNLIHFSQRPAIARAILSPSLKLLDQKGKTPLVPSLLFKPGTVSVIDYQSLDQNKKRVVALYFLQMLSRFKMDSPNFEPGVLLVIDEAEQLFPERPSKSDSDYVNRIESKIEDITNRGRKRKYGIILVTHLPSEVSQKVGDLANTKIAFGCSGANKWIRDHFGKEYISEVNGLPTGTCRICIKAQSERQGSINVRIRIPYIGAELHSNEQE